MQYSCIPRRSRGEFSTFLCKLPGRTSSPAALPPGNTPTTLPGRIHPASESTLPPLPGTPHPPGTNHSSRRSRPELPRREDPATREPTTHQTAPPAGRTPHESTGPARHPTKFPARTPATKCPPGVTKFPPPTPPPLDFPKNHEFPRTFPQPITPQPLAPLQTFPLTPRQNGFFPLPNCPTNPAHDPRKNPENTLTHCQAYTSDANRPLFRNKHSL